MRTELKKLHERLQTTVVYVTHDQVEAMTMGSTIVVLESGDIQQVGAPLDLYNFPRNRFVAGFIGSPSMNFLDCEIVEQNGNLLADLGPCQLMIPGDKATLVRKHGGKEFIFGIRPEDMRNRRDKKEIYNEEHITAQVNVVEPLGKEIFVDLSVGDLELTAIIGAHYAVKQHENFDLTINIDRMHLFDKAGEKLAVAHTPKNASGAEEIPAYIMDRSAESTA